MKCESQRPHIIAEKNGRNKYKINSYSNNKYWISKKEKKEYSNTILFHKKNVLTKALKEFTLVASRMGKEREFHVPTTP